MKIPIKASEFSKNILTLITGTGLAQLIALAAMPVLTRLFTPEEFAPYTLFTAVLGIVSVVAAGRFELAILIPKKEEEAKSLVALSFIFSVITAILTLIGVAVYDFWLSDFWPNAKFSGWFYLLPPAVFIMGAYKAVNYWSTRHKTFKRNAIGRIVTASLVAATGIIFGFIHFVPGLIIAFIIGNLGGLIALSADIIAKWKNFFSGIHRAGIRSVFNTHSDFAKVNVPHSLLDNFQEFGIFFFIAYFFTDALVGLYGRAFQILKAPLTLIGSAYYQVFYQQVTQGNYTSEQVKKMVRNVYKRTFAIGIIPFTINFFYAPEIFAFVFGAEWRDAGVIAQVLTPWLFLNFMVSPVSCMPLIYKRQRGALLITCLDVIGKYSLLIMAGLMSDWYLAFVLLSIFTSCLMLFAMWWYHSMANDKMVLNDQQG